jgi:hypothetical protein
MPAIAAIDTPRFAVFAMPFSPPIIDTPHCFSLSIAAVIAIADAIVLLITRHC